MGRRLLPASIRVMETTFFPKFAIYIRIIANLRPKIAIFIRTLKRPPRELLGVLRLVCETYNLSTQNKICALMHTDAGQCLYPQEKLRYIRNGWWLVKMFIHIIPSVFYI
jgi:hypothetical protein